MARHWRLLPSVQRLPDRVTIVDRPDSRSHCAGASVEGPSPVNDSGCNSNFLNRKSGKRRFAEDCIILLSFRHANNSMRSF